MPIDRSIYRSRYQEIMALHTSRVHNFLASMMASVFGALFVWAGLAVFKGSWKEPQVLVTALLCFVSVLPAGVVIRQEYSPQFHSSLGFKPPILALYSLVVLALVFFTNVIYDPRFVTLLAEGGIPKYGTAYYFLGILLILAVLFPFSALVRFLFFLFLHVLSGLDYELIIDREHFQKMILYKFEDQKRYGGQFSLISVGFRYDPPELGKRRTVRQVARIVRTMLSLARRNMRRSDVLGNFDGGRIVAILSNTDLAGASIVGQRLLELLKAAVRAPREGSVVFRCGISGYDAAMKSPDDLVNASLTCLEDAYLLRDREILSRPGGS